MCIKSPSGGGHHMLKRTYLEYSALRLESLTLLFSLTIKITLLKLRKCLISFSDILKIFYQTQFMPQFQ